MIRATAVERHSRILGLGEYRPAKVVSNDDLALTLDTNDEWIQQRTGIASRRIAGDEDSVVAMATAATTKALADSGVDPGRVGQVIVATCSMTKHVPGASAQVAHAIGATAAGAYDVNAACAGFCYALAAASDAIRTGQTEYVVVAAAERLSDWVDWTERSSAILFADGAGAVVVGPAAAPGIGPLVCGSDGGAADLIGMTDHRLLRLDGPAVFRWATTEMGHAARRVCDAAGVDPADLGAVVLHQANLRIVASIAKQLGATNAVVADDVIETGNTSAASVPLALARLRREGKVATGDLALTLAFGAGLTWAGSVVTVP
ncbi:MAG TPA: beta-ketoacyl-ACP synthase 3 [Mycobacteriales bacterium]|nr:beta-ketoacyl-ACP synthase 3 [Mycobacteriales bacterium]HWC34186.1 beta-ketoacyl-ACP synthase 3 [Mycobacteriales bacterium]